MNISGELPLFIGSSQEEIARFKPAIIGQCDASMRLVYSVSKIIDILAVDMKPCGNPDDPDDEYNDPRFLAMEYYEYNILGAYMGEMTPIYVSEHDSIYDFVLPD